MRAPISLYYERAHLLFFMKFEYALGNESCESSEYVAVAHVFIIRQQPRAPFVWQVLVPLPC